MPAESAKPISLAEARALFAGLEGLPALVLAVSGGPDSTALMWLAARWRDALKAGPKLVAVTVDHGLRQEAKREAAAVARLARKLGVAHRTLRWTGAKPATGLQKAARAARYRLLAQAARQAQAAPILTAHTLDDQAETVLIRMSRGSGITGLAAMQRASAMPYPSPERGGSIARSAIGVGSSWQVPIRFALLATLSRKRGRDRKHLLRRRHPQHAPLRQQRAQRGGLDRLVQQLNAFGTRLFAHAGAAVGGDQDRRQVTAAPAQRHDRLDAIATVEVVIDQQSIWHGRAFRNCRQRGGKIGRFDHRATPAVQQRLHAIEHRRFVVDAKRGGADELAGVDTNFVARRQLDCRGIR
jgi:tRNA(Ile)-lysidine synthetase-like protein